MIFFKCIKYVIEIFKSYFKGAGVGKELGARAGAINSNKLGA